jgi:ribonuclease Z
VKIKFIGTSSAQTTLARFHSSLLLSIDNYNLLVDAGDGISRALLFNKINFNKIDGIILTHLHPDHFSGLPALIVQMKIANRKKPLEIFVHQSLKTIIENTLLNSYILPERMRFEIQYRSFAFDEQLTITNNFNLLAKRNSHLSKLEKYTTYYPSLQLHSSSLLFTAADKKIVYTSDIGSSQDLFLFQELIPDVFICESNHLELPIIFEELKKIETGKIYLTHYSDEDLERINEILATLPKAHKKRINIANDGLSVEI